jgi:two-component system, NtrC family, nitrogen regulation response regulator NtrX
VNNLSKQAKILIVDDDESIRTTLKAILEDEGYSVNTAASGKEAIEKTQETAYNLALLDIRLPDIEGVELLKLMKENIPRTRKIMLTGYPSIQNAIAAVNKNADAYLIKPVDIEKLLATVKDQLKQQEDDQTMSEQKMALFIESRFSEASVDQK